LASRIAFVVRQYKLADQARGLDPFGVIDEHETLVVAGVDFGDATTMPDHRWLWWAHGGHRDRKLSEIWSERGLPVSPTLVRIEESPEV
jgi:hypothetical protein